MSRSHGPIRRLPRKRIQSAPAVTSNAGLTLASNSITHIPEATVVSNGSKPVPSPKPKPRHHKDYGRTTSDLHAKTTSDSHSNASDSQSEITSDLHTTTITNLHSKATIDPLTHTKITTSVTGRSPKLEPKSTSDTDSVTDTAITTATIKTSSGQIKMKAIEVLTKPVTTTTSEFQAENTNSSIQSYHIDTNIDDATNDPSNTGTDELQTKAAHVKAINDSSITCSGSLRISPHTKATSDLPMQSDGGSHTNITDLHATKTDDNFHTRTLHTAAAKHMLDVVSDHFVEETDVGWGPTHKVTANDETSQTNNDLQKRLKGNFI